MKTLLILTSLFSSIALAGGSGGGGVLGARTAQVNLGNGTGTLKAELVRFVGVDRSEIVFEYGQMNTKDELYTQTFRLRTEEFSANAQDILKAIELSKSSKAWSIVGLQKNP